MLTGDGTAATGSGHVVAGRLPGYGASAAEFTRMYCRDEVEQLKVVRLASWRERYGTQRSSGHGCVRRLLPRTKETRALVASLQLPESCDWGCIRPPWADHADLWLRDGHVVAYTSQPYNWNEEKEAEVAAWCMQLRLAVAFSHDDSWHHPGGTTVVTICHPRHPL